jgi:tRNA modification GTPase
VAVASPAGAALRGVVRASGAGAIALAERVAGRSDGESAERTTERTIERAVDRVAARGVHLARLRAPLPPCPCLLVAMPGPASSTGEDTVELHLVGNPTLLERVAAALVHAGSPNARRAGPGEFSARAVLNGRMTVAEAERVAAAVGAATDAQLDAANALRADRVGTLATEVSDAVATLLALVEAGIDFTDQEDVSAIAPARLSRECAMLAARVREAAQGATARAVEVSAPLVLLAGPPNAGKSSLFNALLGRPRAVASQHAGTTRDAIEEPLALPGGTHAMLCDAPGLDHSATDLDALMQAQAEAALERADVVLWCTPGPYAAGSRAPERRVPSHVRAEVLGVVTMCDAAAGGTATADAADKADAEVAAAAPSHPTSGALRTSAVTGEGLAELRRAIVAAVDRLAHHSGALRASSGTIRAELLAAAADSLEAAADLAAHAPSGARAVPHPELVASSLRTALDRLGEVDGAVPPDEVLGRLFSRFCIGK